MSKHYQTVEDLDINLEELIACYEQFKESKGFSTDFKLEKIVDFINRYKREDGKSNLEAALAAGPRRFRPILLTSVTTFVGLFPLLIEKSVQAKFLVPMAISLAFGVLFATIITLIIVQSFLKIANPNWAVTAYISATLMISAYAIIRKHKVLRLLTNFGLIINFALSLLILKNSSLVILCDMIL